MLSPYPSRRTRRQRGDVLLEALMAVLIMSIIGAGTAYVTSRIAVSAKNVRTSGAAVTQMRVLLQQYGPALCTGAADNSMAKVVLPVSYGVQPLTVQCPAASAVTINGLSVTSPSNVVLCVPASNGGVFPGEVLVGSNTTVNC
jgi:type II secretory pathway pseudopilin PulG